ncbi:MAG TPA: ABC transporter ATP-binding protein [Candidatus Dorea intestinavium]|nr:ABC transporter ATP-binding protein [Candidatus Dorea intestinavium]
MGTIEFNHVSKTFPSGYEVIKELNLNIKEGDFVMFVGAPGAGKSTVLRMAAGLENPTGGEVRIDGELLRNIAPEDRSIAMVLQNYALYPKLTAYENIAFGLEQRGYAPDVIKKRVEETAKFFEIEDILKKKPKSLDAGERQRVALSRALITNPKILILDEPLASFEPALRLRLREKIRESQRSSKRTVLYVTHNMDDAMFLATKIVVMKKGKVHQIGTPKEIYEHPKSLFVADFIGEPAINLIDGKCETWGPKAYISTPIAELSFTPGIDSKLVTRGYNGKVVVVGIRPDAFSYVEKGSPQEAKKHNIVKTKVFSAAFDNGKTWVRFEAGECLYNALIETKEELKVGDSITLKIDPDKILVYDKKTKRIVM